MLSRRYQTARSTLDSHRTGAQTTSILASDESMMLAKAKLLDVADRLQQMQQLLRVTSREDGQAQPVNNKGDGLGKCEASSTSFELLSFTLSNAPEETLSLSPLSVYSSFPEATDEDEELQDLLKPVPSGLLSIPDVRYIRDDQRNHPSLSNAINDNGKPKKTAVVFVPIIKTAPNGFEPCVFDKEAVQTQRTTDDLLSSPSSPGGWSDEHSSKLDEDVRARRPKTSRPRGDLLCRFADLSNNTANRLSTKDAFDDALSAVTNTVSRVADDESWDDEDAYLLDENVTIRQPRMCDDQGWDDEPSFLLRENDTAVGRIGKKVKVPPLNLFALPPSPVHAEAAPLKSSHRPLRFASARSTASLCPPSCLQSIFDLCDSLDQLSDELMDNARGSRIFADTMHAKVLRLTDDINRAHTRYTDLVLQLEELERSLGSSLANFQHIPEIKTPSMSPTPLYPPRGMRQMSRGLSQIMAPMDPSPLSEKSLIEHTRDISNFTTQANSPSAHHVTQLVDNGNDCQTPNVQVVDFGTAMTPLMVKEEGSSPITLLQRDFSCLAKPSQKWQSKLVRAVSLHTSPEQRVLGRKWTQVHQMAEIHNYRKQQSLQCSWDWFRTFLLRGAIDE